MAHSDAAYRIRRLIWSDGLDHAYWGELELLGAAGTLILEARSCGHGLGLKGVYTRVSSETTPRHVWSSTGSYSFLLFFSLNNRSDSHCLIAVLFGLNQSQFSKLIHRSCSYLSG